MTKLLLSIAVLATVAAPAFAGRLDDADSSVRQTYTAPAAVDQFTTQSVAQPIHVVPASQSDKARGDQGAFFGANGH